MQRTIITISLAGAALLCGCGKQAKINSEKIDALAQKIAQLQQLQTNQGVVVQSQLRSLVPTLDQMNGTYFEKNRDDAMFFHTNTLYLLLTIGKQIESQLQAADAGRQVQNAQAYAYHTNQLGALELCTAQIEDALTTQESRIENRLDTFNAETKQSNAALSNALINSFNEQLSKQIKALAPDAAEIARRRQLEAEVALIQQQLDQIKARLGITNPPAARP